MTSKEALENIKDNYPLVHPTNYKLIKESYDTLEKLVERDTPKKPIKRKGNYTEKHYYDCPKCEFEKSFFGKFCSECGQRLDWSELK